MPPGMLNMAAAVHWCHGRYEKFDAPMAKKPTKGADAFTEEFESIEAQCEALEAVRSLCLQLAWHG